MSIVFGILTVLVIGGAVMALAFYLGKTFPFL